MRSRSGDNLFARPPAPTTRRAAASLVVMCAQCREEVLEADVIGDEEECLLRDHLLAVHPKTVQPETRSVLLGHFVVTEPGSVMPAQHITRSHPRVGTADQSIGGEG